MKVFEKFAEILYHEKKKKPYVSWLEPHNTNLPTLRGFGFFSEAQP